MLGKQIGMNPTSSTHHQILHHLLNVDLMPARIFILSVILIGIAFLVLPAARYLIWGPELDIELVSIPDDSETGAGRELEIVRLLGKDAIPAILQPKFVSCFGGGTVDDVGRSSAWHFHRWRAQGLPGNYAE